MGNISDKEFIDEFFTVLGDCPPITIGHDTLSEAIRQLSIQFSDLHTKINDKDLELDSLEEDITNLNAEIEDATNKAGQLQDKVEELEAVIDELNSAS